MKKIINGKKYDTETAQYICEYDNCERDFYHVREYLYRKRTGEFFLHGQGGAATCYAEVCEDNSTCWGEKIVPISEKEAKSFAEENMTGSEYEEVFGPVEE